MYRIIKIGMDVHSKNFALCAMNLLIGQEGRIISQIEVTADYKNIILFIFINDRKLKLGYGNEFDIECGI